MLLKGAQGAAVRHLRRRYRPAVCVPPPLYEGGPRYQPLECSRIQAATRNYSSRADADIVDSANRSVIEVPGGSAASKTRRETWDVARAAAEIEESLQPDEELYVTLSNLLQQRRGRDAIALYKRLRDHPTKTSSRTWKLSPSSGSVLLVACNRLHDTATALQLIDRSRMADPAWAHNLLALIKVFCSAKDFEGAIRVLDDMHKCGVQPSALARPCNLLLNELDAARLVERAHALFLMTRKYGVKLDAMAYDVMAKVYARGREGGKAEALLLRASREGVTLAWSTLTRAAKACLRARHMASAQMVAQHVLKRAGADGHDMVEGGEAVEETLTAIAYALGEEQGMNLLYDLAALGIRPTPGMYNAIHMPTRALELFEGRPERSVYDYKEALRALATSESEREGAVTSGTSSAVGTRVAAMLQEMVDERSFSLDPETVELAVRAVSEHRGGSSASDLRDLMEFLTSRGVMPGAYTGHKTISALVGAGMGEEARAMFEDLYVRYLPARAGGKAEELYLGAYCSAMLAANSVGMWPVACWLFDQAKVMGVVNISHLRTIMTCLESQQHGLLESVGRPYYVELQAKRILRDCPRPQTLDLHRYSLVLASVAVMNALDVQRQRWEDAGRPSKVPCLWVVTGTGMGKVELHVLEYLHQKDLLGSADFKEQIERRKREAMLPGRKGSIRIWGWRMRDRWRKEADGAKRR